MVIVSVRCDLSGLLELIRPTTLDWTLLCELRTFWIVVIVSVRCDLSGLLATSSHYSGLELARELQTLWIVVLFLQHHSVNWIRTAH